MTKKEFLEKVIEMNSDAEILEFARKELENIELKNEKAREKRKEKSKERDELSGFIYTNLTAKEPKTCADIIEILTNNFNLEFSTPKVSSLMKKCMDEHEDVMKIIVKIDGKNRVAYALKTSEN